MAGRSKCALVLVLLGLAGCGDSTRLFHSGSTASHTRSTPTAAAPPAETATGPSRQSVYLAQLGAEQARLAAAEARIPTRPRTPAALGRSIDLLATAVGRLADGLARIRAPAAVASRHAQLVTIMRTYAATLGRAGRIAVLPGKEVQAGRLLISATDAASSAFTATIAAIDSTLGSSPT
jgi:hypothetical protein